MTTNDSIAIIYLAIVDFSLTKNIHTISSCLFNVLESRYNTEISLLWVTFYHIALISMWTQWGGLIILLDKTHNIYARIIIFTILSIHYSNILAVILACVRFSVDFSSHFVRSKCYRGINKVSVTNKNSLTKTVN